jgi:hypothetical protein
VQRTPSPPPRAAGAEQEDPMTATAASLGLNKKQLEWARKIVARIKSKNLPADQGRRAADIALATCLVESELKMYANGNNRESLRLPHDDVGFDNGSVGLYQQQVGGAKNSTADWGTTAELMDVNKSTDKFLKALLRLDWLHMTNGAAAQAVQGSAFPDRYQGRDAQAIRIRKALWDTVGSGTTPTAEPTHPAPSTMSAMAIPTGSIQYTVQASDSDGLAAVCRRHAITDWQSVARRNGIAGPDFVIHVGQILTLPAAGGTSASPAAPGGRYTIKPSDSDGLAAVCRRHGITDWQRVARENGIAGPDFVIRAGQTITL